MDSKDGSVDGNIVEPLGAQAMDPVSVEKRVSKPTMKVLCERLERFQSERKQVLNKVKKCRLMIVSFMEKCDVKGVNNVFGEYGRLCNTAKGLHYEVMSVMPMPDDEVIKQNTWFGSCMATEESFSLQVEKWLQSQTQNVAQVQQWLLSNNPNVDKDGNPMHPEPEGHTVTDVNEGNTVDKPTEEHPVHLDGEVHVVHEEHANEPHTTTVSSSHVDGNVQTQDQEYTQTVEDVHPHDSSSNVSGNKLSSTGSSRSSGKSTASQRLRAEAEKAALLVKAKALK